MEHLDDVIDADGYVEWETYGTSVSPGSDVIGADVTLQVGRVTEDFSAVFARVTTAEAVLEHRVPRHQRPAAVPLGAQSALVPPQRKLVTAHQMVIHSAIHQSQFNVGYSFLSTWFQRRFFSHFTCSIHSVIHFIIVLVIYFYKLIWWGRLECTNQLHSQLLTN